MSPFSKVVILVSYFSWPSTEAKTGLGIPGNGVDRDTLGYALPLLYRLHTAMPYLQQSDTDSTHCFYRYLNIKHVVIQLNHEQYDSNNLSALAIAIFAVNYILPGKHARF